MPIVYFTLPFAAEGKNTKTKLSNDMELATIICASETEHIRSKAPDYAKKLTFVSRLYYPIWAISQGKNCFLLDGMRFVTGNIPLLKPPDPEALIDDLKKNAKDQDQFLRTLQRERETFKGFSSRKRILIPGYIDDKQIITDIMSFLKDAKTSTSSSATQSDSFIRPKMDQENAIRVTNGISEHYDALQSEVKGLQYAKEVIIQETQIHTHRLQQELREMQEDFRACEKRWTISLPFERTGIERRKRI